MKTKSIAHTELNAIPSLLLLRCNTFMHISIQFRCMATLQFHFLHTKEKKKKTKRRKNIDSILLCEWDWMSGFSLSIRNRCWTIQTVYLLCDKLCHKRALQWHWKLTFRSNHFVKLCIFLFSRWCFSWNSYAHIIIMSNKRKKENQQPLAHSRCYYFFFYS